MPAPAPIVDVIAVLVFVLIGRSSHAESETLAGITRTSWPFLLGTALGWLLARRRGRELSSPAAGLWVWPTTVVVGMLARAASGQGVDAAFVVVASAFLGLFLLGWRLVGGLARTRLRRSGRRLRD